MTGLLNKSATIKLITDALKEYPNGTARFDGSGY